MKLERILLKLSGEALQGDQQYGIDPERLMDYAKEIKAAVDEKIQVAIVIGGGNIFRGLQGTTGGTDMALQDAFTRLEIRSKVLSGIAIDPVCERMSSAKAIEYLDNGFVVIIAGGTGNPYFTTDTASALRALEIKADAILKGTRVDGVFSADPEKDPKAVKFETLSFDEAYEKGLNIMDLTAFTLCRENHLPIIVFNMNVKGNLSKIIKGEKVGTIVE